MEVRETRNRRVVRQLLRKILRQYDEVTLGPTGKQHRALRGANHIVISANVQKASDYLAALKIAPKRPLVIPTSLNQLIADSRKQAGSARLSCTARILACERLLFLEGITVPPQYNSTEKFLCQQLGIEPPAKTDSVTTADIRAGARRQALTDIVECLEADKASGCFKSIADVILRLPEQEPPTVAQSPISPELQAQIDRVIGGTHG